MSGRRIPERLGSIRRLEPAEAFGLAEVYHGHDERLRRDVLLWPLRDAARSARRAALLHTAAVVGQLDDPRLCQIYECLGESDGDDASGGKPTEWLVLESSPGRPLDLETLSRRRRLRLAQQVAEVLVALHARGAVHGGLGLHSLRGPGSDRRDAAGIRADVKILAPGEPTDADPVEEPSPADDMRDFGALLEQLLGPDVGRLQSLVQKLAANDPERRPTAADALRRLSHERLRPRRLLRRLAVAGGLVLALGWGLAYTVGLRSALQAEFEAREEALRARSEAEELARFLVDLFAVDETLGAAASGPLTARDLLEGGSRRLERDFADRPQLRSRFLLTLGEVYESLGSYERSRQLLEEALRLRQSESSPRPLAVAESLVALGSAARFQGDYAQSARYLEAALDIQRAELSEDDVVVAETLNVLAIVARRQGDYATAERYYLRSLAIREEQLGPLDPSLARGLNNLGLLYYYQGRLEESETVQRRALHIKEATLEANHPSIARSLNNLANLLTDQGRFQEAKGLYMGAGEIWQQVGGPFHPERASSINNLGLLAMERGLHEEAESYLRQAIEVRQQALGADHADSALSLSNLGVLMEAQGRFDEAEEVLRQALTVQERILDPDHPDIGLSLDRLASLHLARQETAEARRLLERSYEINREALGDDHPDTAYSLILLGACDLAEDDAASALGHLQRAVDIFRSKGLRTGKAVTALRTLAAAQEAAGEVEQAAATWVEAEELQPEE